MILACLCIYIRIARGGFLDDTDQTVLRAAFRCRNMLAEIAALPYDVMDTEEARAILNKNPLSFLRVTKSEATMSDCIDPHSQAVYKTAKVNLDRYLADGQMKKDTTPCYYIYRQQMGQHIQIGLVAAASVDEYRENIIKKHELTRHE